VIAGLDLGDETADAERALEGGQEFATIIDATATSQLPHAEANRLRTMRAKATRSQIVQAVERFGTRVRERAETGEIKPPDVLRLRVMLMIVAAAGQPPRTAVNSILQVLPFNGDNEGWPD
jgi:hypothetical protein